jgi:hypothetical protein
VDLESRPLRNPLVVARELAEGEGGVLLHLETGAYHRFNPVGLLIWDQIDGERTVGELIAAVRALVTDPPAGLDEDVVQFLANALARDLVQVAE